jgi:hypothetical protein
MIFFWIPIIIKAAPGEIAVLRAGAETAIFGEMSALKKLGP